MKGNLKKVFVLTLMICLSGTAITVLAAREQGMDSNEKVAYDCYLGSSILPWSNVTGYTNASFIVSTSEINNGFTAYASISASSDDGKKTSSKTAYVSKGTNYAHTGDIEIDGYHSGCSSTHKIVYSGKGVSETIKLSV